MEQEVRINNGEDGILISVPMVNIICIPLAYGRERTSTKQKSALYRKTRCNCRLSNDIQKDNCVDEARRCKIAREERKNTARLVQFRLLDFLVSIIQLLQLFNKARSFFTQCHGHLISLSTQQYQNTLCYPKIRAKNH